MYLFYIFEYASTCYYKHTTYQKDQAVQILLVFLVHQADLKVQLVLTVQQVQKALRGLPLHEDREIHPHPEGLSLHGILGDLRALMYQLVQLVQVVLWLHLVQQVQPLHVVRQVQALQPHLLVHLAQKDQQVQMVRGIQQVQEILQFKKLILILRGCSD